MRWCIALLAAVGVSLGAAAIPAAAVPMTGTDLSIAGLGVTISGRTITVRLIVHDEGPGGLTEPYLIGGLFVGFDAPAPDGCNVSFVNGNIFDCRSRSSTLPVGGADTYTFVFHTSRACKTTTDPRQRCRLNFILEDRTGQQFRDQDDRNDQVEIINGKINNIVCPPTC
jgi:hypothetical protein